MKTPVFTLIAGPNGVGKSTLVSDLERDGLFLGPFINPDDIKRALGPHASERQAARFALHETERHLREKRDFSRETTLSSKESIRVIRKAAEATFFVRFIYIGADHLELTAARVEARARQGGHDIPYAVQQRRFPRSLENAVLAAKIANETLFFQNTVGHQLIARYAEGHLQEVINPAPAWFRPIRDSLAKLA